MSNVLQRFLQDTLTVASSSDESSSSSSGSDTESSSSDDDAATAAAAVASSRSPLDALGRTLVRLPNNGPLLLVIQTPLPGALAHVQVDIVVGDDNEVERKDRESAHFIEHLVASLLLSRYFPDGNAKRLAEEAGIESNASTSAVRTSYYMSGLDSDLERMIQMQCGAINDFERYFIGEKDERYSREVEAVRRELKSKVADADYQVMEALDKLVYTSHPRATPQATDARAIKKKRGADVLAFFNAHYTTSNMLVTVASTRDRNDVVKLLSMFDFSALSRREAPQRVALPAASARAFDAPVVHYVSQPQEATTRVALAYPLRDTTSFDLPRNATARALSYLLTGGFSSRLLRRLRVTDGLVYSVLAYSRVDERSGDFSLFRIATTCDDDKVARVLAAIDEEMAAMARDGPTADEMDKWRRCVSLSRERAALSRQLDGFVDAYSSRPLFTGAVGPRIVDRFDALRAVKARSVQKLAARLVRASHVIVVAGPKEPRGASRTRNGGSASTAIDVVMGLTQ